MLRSLQGWMCALAAALVAGWVALPAWGGPVLDPQSLGAAVVVPYLTRADGGERVTVASVTNGLTDAAINLHAIWISGDAGEDWAAIDFDCPLTPLETTYFVFEHEPGGTAQVTFECSDLGQSFPNPRATNNVVRRSVPGESGIMFLSVECQLGAPGCEHGPLGSRTLRTNALLASATVIDFGQGRAFSVSGIHIQGVPSVKDGGGDRHYVFDGREGEYASFPSVLTASYIAPDEDTTLEVILFTLDGTVSGGPGITGQLSGFAFDDDENPTSGSLRFDCFTIQDLAAPPPLGFGLNIRRDFGGHRVGHLQLYPSATVARDVHEYVRGTGDGNGVRRRPVHGWIVQTVAQLGDLMETGNRASSPASWARTFGQGPNPLQVLEDDTPSLNSSISPLEDVLFPTDAGLALAPAAP